MSFSLDVKKEIANVEANEINLKAELYGFLKLKGELVIRNKMLVCTFKTNSLSIVRRITSTIKKLYQTSVSVLEKERKNLDHRNIYYISLDDKSKEILRDLKIIVDDFNFIDEVNLDYPESSVIRGMFLAKGSINDPKSSRYHFEISCNLYEEASYICEAVSKYGIVVKVTKRKEYYVAYIKKAEHIGDILKIMGAINNLFDFENERIKRDLNNVVNRMINCDMANGDKMQAAAKRQLDAIKIIEETKGFESLSIRLMEAVTLRTNNPEGSLQDLSNESEEVIGRYISKSGLNHCFKDIELYAKTLKTIDEK